jgi:nitrogenase iron protein NifH
MTSSNISAALSEEKKKIIEECSPDIIICDVLGDVVCGGFAMPIREGAADQVNTVSSSDFMSLYASNSLFKGIKKYAKSDLEYCEIKPDNANVKVT